MTVAVAGATGYIGKSVVRELVRRGYKTKALVREESLERAKAIDQLRGAKVRNMIVMMIVMMGLSYGLWYLILTLRDSLTGDWRLTC